MSATKLARLYRIRGRVQGVGFRYFAEKAAQQLGVSGWVRNDDDGSVEVYAVGNAEQLAELAGMLRRGPRWAEVRGVDESEAALERLAGFSVRQ
ncbi:MAG TPA: acylphosphatase [Bryobacteraceae bacterium]|nr:acylphosphatase [Bryobacteraceae bacterium]